MSELKDYIKILKNATLVEQGKSQIPRFSPIFHFPNCNNYFDWLNKQLESFPSKGRRWVDLYREIIANQMTPYGMTLPEDWKKSIISHPTNCLDLIADEQENILYVGKSEYPAITRILDCLVPQQSEKFPKGQVMNNIPEIWDDYISKGKRVKFFYCYDLDFDPEILEYYVLYKFKMEYGRLPKFNKKLPNKTALSMSVGIADLLETENILSKDYPSDVIRNVETSLDQTLGKQYCPICLKKPKNRKPVIQKYIQLIDKNEIVDDIEQIYNTLILDDELIENYLLWDAKHLSFEIFSELLSDEDGKEIPCLTKDAVYELYIKELEITGINSKIGRCGCTILLP